MHAAQAIHGFHPHTALAHGEVAAFEQGQTQVAREQRMLEVSFVVRTGCEQADQRRTIPFG